MGLEIKKGTTKMPYSSLLIRDIPKQTSPGEIKPEHEEAKRVHGRKRIPSHIFWFKVHTKEDCDHGLIRELRTTTASLHDSQVDLLKRR